MDFSIRMFLGSPSFRQSEGESKLKFEKRTFVVHSDSLKNRVEKSDHTFVFDGDRAGNKQCREKSSRFQLFPAREVDFEDFFIWFLKYMPTELDRSNPASPFASKWLPAPPAAERTPRMQLHHRKFSKNVERTPSSALGESSVKSLASRRTVDF